MALGRSRLLALIAAVTAFAAAADGRAQSGPPELPAIGESIPAPHAPPPAPPAHASPAPTPAEASARPSPPRAAPAKPRPAAAKPPAQARAKPSPPPAALQPAIGQPIPAPELEAFVDGLAAEAMARDHIAGAVVAVVQDGRVLLDKGYGVDRLAPARAVDPARTLFRLGPVTETFTWIEVLREVEAGHMRLDAPVDQYLRQSNQVPDQGFAQPVRLRDLMSQGAGFEERRFGQIVETDPNLIRPLETYLEQERPRRIRPPGQFATYTAYDAALAGEALAQVTGTTPQALTETEILQPLGLNRTTLREPYPPRPGLPAPMDPGLAQGLSRGFRWTGSGLVPQRPEFTTQLAPAEAGSSSGADMARYLMAILGDGTLEGRVIYSPAVARQLRTPLLQPAPGVRAWDHGVLEYPLPDGLTGYGRDGGALDFRASLVTVPRLGLGVFVAANTSTAGDFVRSVPSAIVQRFYARPQPPTAGSPWLADHASAFAGTYLTTARAFRGLEGFVDRFRGRAKVTVSRDGYLLAPGLGGPQRWVPDEGASTDQPTVRFHQADGPGALVFQLRDGRARRWFAPSGEEAYERDGLLSRRGALAALSAATALAALAALVALVGLFVRDRRDFRQTPVQARADGAQISASVLWLLAMGCFAAFYLGAADPAALAVDWPSAWLLIASACALVASLVTVLCLGLLPAAWRGGRRLDSWTMGRKLRFTATTVVFALFGALLGVWGALEPWSR